MKPVRYGMIGGGQGAFIGGVHRIAAAISGNWQLAAGAFSSTAEKSKASGAEIGVDPARTYGSWAEMLEREAVLPADVRIEAVAIVTPSHMHAAPAIAAMEAGFDVIIDKPLADTLVNATAIAEAATRNGRRIAIAARRWARKCWLAPIISRSVCSRANSPAKPNSAVAPMSTARLYR